MQLDPFASTRPAGAYDALVARVGTTATPGRPWEEADGPLPALFLSHGAPTLLEDATWVEDLHAWARTLPVPRGIVVVSAHWEEAPAALSNAEAGAPLFYDFGGFHPRYYDLRYATPDATALAERVAGLVQGPGGGAHRHTTRGLDHGAFVPLLAMYPAADVPVVQLSMPTLAPEPLLRFGERLRSLREEGVLVVGSGFMTHSFAVFRHPQLVGHTRAFDAWAAEALAHGDVESLLDHRAAPGAQVAHPTAEHYVPLLVALGAATAPDAPVTTPFARMWFGNSTRSFQAA